MKLKISFFAIFCAITSVFAQSYEVIYSKGSTIDESQLQNLPEEIKAKLKSTKTYSLSIDGQKSFFKENTEAPQSTHLENGKNSISFSMKTSKYDLYKNLKTNNLYVEATLGSEEYNIADKLPNIDWNTTNETDTILEYKVKKAQGEYKNKPITVWYTEEIPVKDGPLFYRGVDGLVLKVEYGKENYVATHIQKGTKQKINIPNNKNTITLDEYNKKKEEVMQNLLKNQGGGSTKIIRL